MRGAMVAAPWIAQATLLLVLACVGQDIVVPSPAQLRYQSTDFVALIHFNMGTFAHNGDPCCDKTNWAVHAPYATGETRDPATFNPTHLNVSQWFDSIVALGANIAVLTAKHGCGFVLWPTDATLPDGSPYGYDVGASRAIRHDVAREFVDAARAAGVGYGFYYSIAKSFYLCRGFSGENTCLEEILPGQRNLTDGEYHRVVAQHLEELWSRYGRLSQIWVDSALEGFEELMVRLQPQAVGIPASPTVWCGTESGHPSRDVGPGDVWSMGKGHFGSPNGTSWTPRFCDPQLFRDHVWFWEPGLAVRTLDEMIPIYHDIVGRGMVMELAFSVNREGLVDPEHAEVYRQLGDWVRACYGAPLAAVSGRGRALALRLPEGATFDRILLQEDIASGQRVRSYAIEARLQPGGALTTLARGSAIGRKRIHVLVDPMTVGPGSEVVLRVEEASAEPQIRAFGAFAPCAVPSGAARSGSEGGGAAAIGSASDASGCHVVGLDGGGASAVFA